MKRHVLKFDRFLVWIFQMKRGEFKNLKPIEVTRGLTTHGPHTIYPITVFVSGSFHSIRPGRKPWLSMAGDGGEVAVDCDHLAGHGLLALENNSEYHCITPREDTPRFWNRKIHNLKAGDVIGFHAHYPHYIYLASGKLVGISDKMIINIQQMTQLVAEQDSIVAVMW